MIKIAFFVEGKTESIFIERFLTHLLKDQTFDIKKCNNITLYKVLKENENDKDIYKYYFFIYDVGGNDKTVVSKICEIGNRFLEEKKYSKIFGLCDLFEKKRTRKDKEKVLTVRNNLIKQKVNFSDKISIILAIMEIEAWFLADHNLFAKIHPHLIPDRIKEKLGIDLIKDDPEEDYDKPANLIKDIYRLVEKTYDKHEKDAYKIVDSINYEYLYLDTKGKKISAFHLLVDKLEEGLNLKSP